MNMDFLVGPIIVGTLCYFFYKILQLYACRRERIMLIEKIESLPKSGDMPSEIPGVNSGSSDSRFVSLRWGAIICGLGLGLLAAYLISYINVESMYANGYNRILNDAIEVVYAACSLLGGGLGLLTAFFVEIRLRKQ
mgnify:CR=1 FL=1